MAKKKYYQDKMNTSSMVKEDRSKPSNLPTEVIMKQYPSQDYINAPVEDTMEAMDMQFNNAVRGTRKQLAKKKY